MIYCPVRYQKSDAFALRSLAPHALSPAKAISDGILNEKIWKKIN